MSDYEMDPTEISVPKDTIDSLRMAGENYLTYDVELRGVGPGVLMNYLDPEVLAPAPESGTPIAKPTRGGRKGATPQLPVAEAVDDHQAVQKDHRFVSPPVKFVTRPSSPLWAARPDKLFKSAVKVAYLTDDGVLSCPTANLMGMISAAASAWERKSGLSRAVGSGIFIDSMREDDLIPFLRPDNDEPYRLEKDTPIRVLTRPYQVSRSSDLCALMVPTSSSRGKKILTARMQLPCWEERDSSGGYITHGWKLRFRVRYDAAILPKSVVDKYVYNCIWLYAGVRVGLMNWRPDAPRRPGPYGRFQVLKHEKV